MLDSDLINELRLAYEKDQIECLLNRNRDNIIILLNENDESTRNYKTLKAGEYLKEKYGSVANIDFFECRIVLYSKDGCIFTQNSPLWPSFSAEKLLDVLTMQKAEDISNIYAKRMAILGP